MTYLNQHAKVARIEVSIGKDDDYRTLEEFIDAIRYMLTGPAEVAAHNVTIQGSYYILDGQVCLPEDYDPATKDRKPGTYPPEWAGGPKRATVAKPVESDEEPREFVRVPPSPGTQRRDPVTGQRPRKPRSDKGKARGPRKARTETPEAAAS